MGRPSSPTRVPTMLSDLLLAVLAMRLPTMLATPTQARQSRFLFMGTFEADAEASADESPLRTINDKNALHSREAPSMAARELLLELIG